jgi:hypothetical protein
MSDKPGWDPWFLLGPILLLALALRLWGIDFGLPNIYSRPDETTLVHRALAIGAGDFNPHFFNYPSLQFYWLAALYGVYFAVGYATGLFSGLADFEMLFFSDPSSFFLLGRLLTALLGTASIAVVYLIGKHVQNATAGLISALFTAVAFLHVRDSHFLTVDVPALFHALLAVLFLVRFSSEGRLRFLLVGGVFLGLAASTKYNLGLFAPMAAWCVLIAPMQDMERGKRLLILAAVVATAFVVTSPFVVLDFPSFWRDLSYERAHFARGHGMDLGWGWVRHVRFSLPLGLGWPLFALGLIGCVRWFWRCDQISRGLLVALVVYYLVAGSGKVVFMRYALPLVPLLCLAAGCVLDALGQRYANWAVWLGVLLVAVPMAYVSGQHSHLLARADTRVLAARWIEQNAETGERIALCATSDYDYVRLRRTAKNLEAQLRELRAAGLPARRVARQLHYGGRLPGPAYDLIELRLGAVRDARVTRGECDIGSLVELKVDWLVVHERDPRASPRLNEHFARQLAQSAELAQLYEPYILSSDVEPIYDLADAFFAPVGGMAAVERPGPRVSIYRMKPNETNWH